MLVTPLPGIVTVIRLMQRLEGRGSDGRHAIGDCKAGKAGASERTISDTSDAAGNRDVSQIAADIKSISGDLGDPVLDCGASQSGAVAKHGDSEVSDVAWYCDGG